ncbi:hypothetical protein AAFC00_002745 [Neodothiora populina]|uniref:Ribosome biogenesis protein Alb1 n=1 Tax=Neodothiora populina TaxID=2781224 RepID=A0ABR3P837_9PEZI
MGKFAKAKKAGQISSHSRAARRAASPSLDVDKSITSLKAPVDAVDYNPKSSGVHDGGISKKKNTKHMTRAQRLRHEKGLNRADQVIDILEQKRMKSGAREKRTKDRAGDWEELNKKYANGVPSKGNLFQAIQEQDAQEDDLSDDDGPSELKAVNKQTISAQNVSSFEQAPEVPTTTSAPDVSKVEDEDIDEVL